MNKIILKASKRSLLGKKVKKLRHEGILPANVYGQSIKSQAIQVSMNDFQKVHKKAGKTKIVDLEVDKDILPVLIQNIQTNPLTGVPVHTDFYRVNLKQKIQTEVSVELIGEARAVVEKIGMLLQTLNKVEIEALPTDLPEKLTLDVSKLAKVDEELKVMDLKLPVGVELITDKNISIVKVGELVSKEAEALAEQEAAAAAAAKAESQAAPTATDQTAPATPEPTSQPAEKVQEPAK